MGNLFFYADGDPTALGYIVFGLSLFYGLVCIVLTFKLLTMCQDIKEIRKHLEDKTEPK